MDVEYISLHRYIRNTPSGTEVLADAPAESTGVPEPWEKNTQNHTKLGRMKELEGKVLWEIHTSSGEQPQVARSLLRSLRHQNTTREILACRH